MLDERRKVDKTRRWRLRQGEGEREKRARGDVRQEVEARRCCCSIARSLGLVSCFLAAYGQLECCLLPRGLFLLLFLLLLHSHNFAIASSVHGRDSLYLLPLSPSSIFLRAILRADATLSLSVSAPKFPRFSSHFFITVCRAFTNIHEYTR